MIEGTRAARVQAITVSQATGAAGAPTGAVVNSSALTTGQHEGGFRVLAELPREDTRRAMRNRSVFLVDDDQLLRRSLKLAIDHEQGLEVVGEAATGEEAVDQTRALRPDVVLMDIRMPGGDGIQATQDICADPELASTKVIVLTMFELDEYVYGALRAGASAFLLKDSTPERLVEAIKRVHKGESLGDEPARRALRRSTQGPRCWASPGRAHRT